MSNKLKNFVKKILPKKMLNLVKKKPIYFKKSYSQEGEDMLLARLLDMSKKGFYVDIGAYHPKKFSNTYFFYKKGWSGINIDAMPNSMEIFKKIRPRDVNLEKAISNKKQILEYYIFDEQALNGFSKKISEERNKIGNHKIIKRIKIKTSTLTEILDKYLPKKTKIDFFSIDAEGLDLNVLKSNNWDKYRPKAIAVEALGKNFKVIENSEIAIFLKEKNYEPTLKSVNTIIFTKKNENK